MPCVRGILILEKSLSARCLIVIPRSVAQMRDADSKDSYIVGNWNCKAPFLSAITIPPRDLNHLKRSPMSEIYKCRGTFRDDNLVRFPLWTRTYHFLGGHTWLQLDLTRHPRDMPVTCRFMQ